MQPWREALRRCVPGEAGQYFSRMSDAVSGVPELRPMLRSLISGNPGLALLYLRDSTPQEFREWSGAILKNDPALHALSDPQKTELFRLWAERGDAVELTTLLSANPAWQPLAWRQIAMLQAAGGDVKGACETFLKFMPVPVLPNFSPAEKIDAMSRRLLLKPNDYKTGYALYAALTAEKNTARALKVLRGLTSRADCPSYFHYLEARLAFEMQDYATAWNAAKKSGRFPE